ncbi:MAG TPA: type 4a pilus biogenesis protein PilO [Acidimicrobiia bacterium]|nr:type 4a pilus biogenesis protein PilO [Acidimicrobiia bacterium]
MRRWALLGVLLVLLLTVGWWFLLIAPRNARIAEEQDNLQAVQQQEVTLRTQIARLQEIRDSEVEYLAGLGKMQALIPEEPLLDRFIDELFSLTEATGVELSEMSPAVPVVVIGSELRQIEVEAIVRGEFFEVLGFLFGLNDMERLVRVDAINLASSQDEQGATVLSAGLTMRLFSLSDLLPAMLPDLGTGQTTTTTTVPEETTTITAANEEG